MMCVSRCLFRVAGLVNPLYKIIHYIAGILHNPPYTLNPSRRSRMNFHVELKRGNNAPGRPHSGRACLTLPTEEIGRRFLADFRIGGLSFHRRTIRVKLSDRRLNSQIVDEIRSTLYEDPHTIEADEPHDTPVDRLGEAFDLGLSLEFFEFFLQPPPDPIVVSKVKTIQFGWMCRDGVFSIEWEISPSSCGIFFDDDERQIRIKISNADSSSLVVVLRPSQIQFSSASLDSSRTPMLYFDLTQPPMFESQKRFAPTRQRLSSLSSDHEPFAPYTSLAMRLVCLDKEQLTRYKRLCRTEKMRIPRDISISSECRGLFLPNVQKELRRWLLLLPWSVAFQVEALIRRLDVDFKEMLGLRQRIEALVQDRGEDHTSGFLHYFASHLRMLSWSEDEEGPWSIEQCFTHAKHEYEVQTRAPPISAPDTMDCRHVYVTPTTIVLEGPNPEQSNRIIRFYSEHQDRFLRVCFVDEGRLHYRFDRGVDRRAFIQNRVGHILREGLEIAGRQFQFLAYSMSGLKEHSVWFVSPFDDERHGHVDASTIIEGLGSFTRIEPRLIYCPARYGARISQAFTATDPSFVEIEEIVKIDDIERNGSVFTDGVGTISPEMARAIWIDPAARRKRRNRPYPRAFQIRFMGSKGMLSVDYKLSGRTICLRPSMIKFEAPESQKIEIAQPFDRPRNYYLNRPLIMLLEGLGVKYEAFKSFQDRAVTEVDSATKSLSGAAWMFERHGLGSSFRLPSVMLNLSQLGVETPDDPFFSRMMDYAVHHVLRDLKDYARIPIPGAWTLVGVADVHQHLEAGEIFACIKDPNSSETIYLEGPTVISRSPTIHPGDVQIAKAIGRPPVGSCFAKEPLANTVVFSVKGGLLAFV
jgi:RNA-dependent RNA polymerase